MTQSQSRARRTSTDGAAGPSGFGAAGIGGIGRPVLLAMLLLNVVWFAAPIVDLLRPSRIASRGDMALFRARESAADLEYCRSEECTFATTSPRMVPMAGVPATIALPEPVKLPIPPGIEFSTSIQADSATDWVAMPRNPDEEPDARWGIRYATNSGGYHIDWVDTPGPGFVRALLPTDTSRSSTTIEAHFSRERAVSRKTAPFEQRPKGDFFAFEFQPVPETIHAQVPVDELRQIAVGDKVQIAQWPLSEERRPTEPVVWQVAAVEQAGAISRLALQRRTENGGWWLMQRARMMSVTGAPLLPKQVELKVDRTFGGTRGHAVLVPRSAVTGLHAASEAGQEGTTLATVWVRFDGFAVPVQVRPVAYRGPDAIVVEHSRPRTPAVAPEHWKLLTDFQRKVLTSKLGDRSSNSLLQQRVAVIENPTEILRPGLKIRAPAEPSS